MATISKSGRDKYGKPTRQYSRSFPTKPIKSDCIILRITNTGAIQGLHRVMKAYNLYKYMYTTLNGRHLTHCVVMSFTHGIFPYYFRFFCVTTMANIVTTWRSRWNCSLLKKWFESWLTMLNKLDASDPTSDTVSWCFCMQRTHWCFIQLHFCLKA